MKNAEGPAKLFHIVIGTPDEENCPVCRAHSVGHGDQESDGPASPLLIQELSFSEILRCPCPLCQEVREEETEE